MFVEIEPYDEVVCKSDFKNNVVDIRVMYNEDEDTYYTIWKRSSGKFQVMWRGNFAGCLKEFADIVGDVFVDRNNVTTGA
jgi:hypothetical protein